MLRHPRGLALALLVPLSACTGAPDGAPRVEIAPDPAPVEPADPMAPFARLIPGAWQVTFASGAIGVDSWHWGPGQHSVRSGELEVYYWHPGRKEIRMLSMHADIPGVGRGVGEGTIRFDGDVAEGVFDLYQPRGPRKLGLHWRFEGPDKYHDTLLEQTGPEGLRPANGWVRVRIPRPEGMPRGAAEARPPSEALQAFGALVGGTWEADGAAATGNLPRTRTTFEWIPDYIHVRAHAPGRDGEPVLLLEAYVYQHVKTGALRCLALSESGGVYEGDLSVLESGALQFDMKGCERDEVVPLVVRLDLDPDATLRLRVESSAGGARALVLDARHRKRPPQDR